MNEVIMGEFEVCGTRIYRDKHPGETFEARLDRAAVSRAVARGDIRVVRVVEPTIQSGSYTLPDGWLAKQGKE